MRTAIVLCWLVSSCKLQGVCKLHLTIEIFHIGLCGVTGNALWQPTGKSKTAELLTSSRLIINQQFVVLSCTVCTGYTHWECGENVRSLVWQPHHGATINCSHYPGEVSISSMGNSLWCVQVCIAVGLMDKMNYKSAYKNALEGEFSSFLGFL